MGGLQPSLRGPCVSEACSAPGATVRSGRASGFWVPRRAERDRAGWPAADGGITAHRKWLKPGCGFALLTKWLFTGSVSSVSSCVYPRLREHWGTGQRDLRFLWAHAARLPELLCVSGLWHPQLKCSHQKTAGTEGNSSYPPPPEFLLSVTFSSGL